ncbi:NAD(P)/FAD-dependent oxidoreductase [Luteimonas huabeiensis]|uniref:NAD(P)/FAD-dependent oxidoreductase n=1 Tax=Luteimonas huabeiensis TaxID=1244513 RepID=UPI0004675AE4|nr:FAD-dependent oxidoreductase [Luteimonas huabeiensis]
MDTSDDVLIVGGGVVGLASALALLETGRRVRVLEAGTAGCGSSHGNCGTITPSHAAPLAAPGAIGKALGWMLTPDAPFYVKPRFDPALWRWMLGFAARSNRRDWTRAMAARAAILQASREALPEWIARYGLDCEFEASGVDYVYRDARELDRFGAEAEALRALGIAVEIVGGTEYLREEPALREGVAGVVRFPGDARLRPDRYVAGLARAVRERGGAIEEGCAVEAIEASADGVRARTVRGRFAARDLVLAAGAWSPKIGRALGLRIPVQPGKGYSITYSRPALAPKRPIVLKERSVCVTVWDSGYRLGSTMEFSGYDTTLNRRRLDALERGAAEYLHEPVGPRKEEEWYGWRPLAIDDMPLIGRAPGHAHVWLATGHGMLGVSMSAATARLVAELVSGAAPHLDPAPFDPARFG